MSTSRSEYEYDALGRRVAKHHTQAGGARQTTLFMWDGDWMMQEVRSGRTSHEDRAVTYVPHPDHEGPLTRLAEGAAWHYVTDHLGTPQELYDEQREVVWAADLSAYGRMARRLALAVDNPIRFPGQYYDRESGLHYNRFRYYDPMVGRYINQDPIGLMGGLNHYSYADGDPINRIDPNGTFAFLAPLIPVALLTLKKIATGAAIEIGMQALKNYKDGCDLLDVDNYDVWDIAWSGAIGGAAPGWGSVGKTTLESGSAIKKLSNQLGRARTENRVAKIEARISDHRSQIGGVVAAQGAWQIYKFTITSANGDSRACRCKGN
ncbi:RHS repeat-associated core domain-containing protein [Burkholderia anthina]|uniref:RHS repeat-associated core domain-containing protein n=1 Tax=Burkholderia anthina TaxID=179879 RepID=UPI003C7A409F